MQIVDGTKVLLKTGAEICVQVKDGKAYAISPKMTAEITCYNRQNNTLTVLVNGKEGPIKCETNLFVAIELIEATKKGKELFVFDSYKDADHTFGLSVHFNEKRYATKK